ncbi:MAG: TonB-dependent receptor [Acidobacteriaceae bacterium]
MSGTAQVNTGQVTGVVTDTTGAVIGAATVTLQNNETGAKRTVQTDGQGSYSASALTPGAYTVTITASGFGAFKTLVGVTVGGYQTVDAKLGVQANLQTVEVSASDVGAQVNTSDQQIASTITPLEVTQLPSLTRNPYDFVSLSGDVSSDPAGSTSRGVGVSFSGERAASTEILLDGVENVDAFGASVGQTIPLDAVQEYSVITDGFPAEYGRASGGIVNLVTKSGTNKLHGSVYEYNRISALAANTYNEDATDVSNVAGGIAPLPADHFTRNQFGYSVGGPIMRDKMFAFSNTEWTRIRSSGVESFAVPSASFLAAAAPATQAYFAAYGKLASGTSLGSTLPVAGFTSNPLQEVNATAAIDAGAGSPQNTWNSDERFDWNLNGKNSMFFRAAVYSESFFPGYVSFSPYDGYNTSETDMDQSYLYSFTHLFTTNLVSSTRISFNRLKQEQPLGAAGVTPTLYLNQANVASSDVVSGNPIAMPGYLPLSPGGAIPFGGPQNFYQFMEDLTWTKGPHTMQFGGGFIQLRDNRVFGAYETANELVDKSGTVEETALQDLQAGNLYQFEVAIDPQGEYPCSVDETGDLVQTSACTLQYPLNSPDFERENTFNDGNMYAQDSWKLNRRLTLDLGLRWEYFGVQHNHNPNLESNFFAGSGNQFEQIRTGAMATTPNSPVGGLIAQQKKNFGPRIGFAWDPFGNGKWALRGGYGISYERNFGNVTYNAIQNPPNYAGVVLNSFVAGVQQMPVFTSNLGPFAASSGSVPFYPPSVRILDPHMPTAYGQQWDLVVEHEIAANTLLQTTYSGTRGIHQYSIANVNEFYAGNVFMGDTNPGNRINYQYGAMNLREANGDSYYDALDVHVADNNYGRYGLQMSFNYTYAHALDNLSSTFSESENNFNLGFLNPFNPSLDHGNADYDVRQRVSIGGVYQPDFLEFNGNRLMHSVLGGLEFAPIATLATGNHFTIYDCTNGYNGCPRIVGAPDLKFKGTPVNNGGVNSFNYLTIPSDSANPYVNAWGISDLPSCAGCYQNPGLGRNQWEGPGNVSFDLGAYKNFTLGESEKYSLQLRGEFYDVLNHHNYYIVGNVADIAEEPAVTAVKGAYDGFPSSGDERRNVQLALRFQF